MCPSFGGQSARSNNSLHVRHLYCMVPLCAMFLMQPFTLKPRIFLRHFVLYFAWGRKRPEKT